MKIESEVRMLFVLWTNHELAQFDELINQESR